MLVKDIMTREVKTVKPGDSVRTALELARSGRFRHLPVVSGDTLVGVVSDRDMRLVSPSVVTHENQGLLENTLIQDVMHSQVITAHPLDPVEDAAKLMYQHKIGCLPVVAGSKLVGIITETDVLRWFVELSGGLRAGSRVELECADKPGMLALVGQITQKHGINVASVLTTRSRTPGRTTMLLRMEAMDIRAVIADLKEQGFEVRWPLDPGSKTRAMEDQ